MLSAFRLLNRLSTTTLSFLFMKPITLLLESAAAKDMSCLIAGYCRVFMDPNFNVFPWIDDTKKHRVSAEEGAKKTLPSSHL